MALVFAWAVGGFILLKWLTQIGLARLNCRHIGSHAGAVPDAFKEMVDEPTYARSVNYSLAGLRLDEIEATYDAIVLLVLLFSGLLPWGFAIFTRHLGNSAWSGALFLFAAGLVLSLLSTPLAWYYQFGLEERFGFNTSTQKLWWLDRLKGLALAALLAFPLLWLLLKLVEWSEAWWWLWAWGVLLGFQLLMSVLAPVLILPWFNKFSPLPEGRLRDRLFDLARRTHFRAGSIQVMDGSKRSRHSNAFFTGFGRFRKIVLFDTLVQQLTEPELEAVLAHEIGHFKKRHIPKMLAYSSLASLGGLYVLSWVAKQAWFGQAFGFPAQNMAVSMLLFRVLSGLATFWFLPLAHWWSRRFEYEADDFAAEAIDGPASLIGALRKLNEKNLSNLTPHPLYSGFYYSHPTLLERENALKPPA